MLAWPWTVLALPTCAREMGPRAREQRCWMLCCPALSDRTELRCQCQGCCHGLVDGRGRVIGGHRGGGHRRTEGARFAAAIAYYPTCAVSAGVLTAPALNLVGEQDDWTPAAACRKLAAHESDVGITRDAAKGTPIDLVVYPNATHGFDYRIPPQRYLGHSTQYDESVSRDAETRVRAFLRRVLGDQAEGP